MKFIFFVILCAVLPATAECFLPWYMIAIVPFALSALMQMRGGASFLAGFIGVGVFWFMTALLKDIPNNHILSARMANLFHLSDYGLLMFLVSILGGLIGGLSAWCGSLVFVRKVRREAVRAV